MLFGLLGKFLCFLSLVSMASGLYIVFFNDITLHMLTLMILLQGNERCCLYAYVHTHHCSGTCSKTVTDRMATGGEKPH